MDVDGGRTERATWRAALMGAAFALGAVAVVLLNGPVPRPRADLELAPVPVDAASPTAAPTRVAPAVSESPALPLATAVPRAAAEESPSRVVVTRVVGGLVLTLSAGPAWKVTPESLLSPLDEDVVAAYLRYWDVRMRAYDDLDTTHLGDVMGGEELARAEAGVREMREQGRAARLDIAHDFRLLNVSPDEAEVYDQYVDHGVLLDAATRRELPTAGAPPVRKILFQLKKMDGVWKVVDGARDE